MTTTTNKYPVLTDEAIAEARKIIGVPLRRRHWNTVATIDAIRYYTVGIGSRNPLYFSETYGLGTFYGCLIAHPTFLYSVDDTIVAPKLAGIHSIYAGTDWQWFRAVKINDAISSVAKVTDIVERTGQFCGKMVLQLGEVAYRNQWDQPIAIARSAVMRTPRDAALAKGKYAGMAKYRYSNEELKKIADSYDAETVKGGQPRYWEDTNIGEEITPVVKGALESDDMLQFITGVLGVRTFGNAMRYQRRHPADIFHDPIHGMWDTWEASYLKDEVAREFGWPAAHDTGYQRVAWLEHAVTNWMGDHAFLHNLNVRVVRPAIYGDTNWGQGKVTKKWQTERQSFVELEVGSENQRGETTAKGTVVVSLVDRRLGGLPHMFLADEGYRE